ncbi:dUTP diphosphatase [Brevibacillus laterosporus]|uniref:dUTP diphosphatase n=1 Tax=Brevibacillus laterosporus TaxID=1465 RepID=UPI00215BF3D0|nr:dUTP diphosphatase [Brevibacillus laterosporus]MCR8994503.1 dUTP diphosphatase [Brevibacillus laterosporus]
MMKHSISLEPLNDMQRQLNDYIIRKKRLEGQDLWENTILALRVELSEFANEVKCFKHWSNKPMNRERALEEAADVLHFLLSVGIYLDEEVWEFDYRRVEPAFDCITSQFNQIFDAISTSLDIQEWRDVVEQFIELIYMIGFTLQQIAGAYIDKWKINIQRQESGY